MPLQHLAGRKRRRIAVGARARRDTGQQLGVAAVARDVVYVELRTAGGIGAIFSQQNLPRHVDPQRFPGIHHGSAREIGCRIRISPISRVDNNDTEVSAIGRSVHGT